MRLVLLFLPRQRGLRQRSSDSVVVSRAHVSAVPCRRFVEHGSL
jgi:hypothetical protein